jgi:TolA-binding protein
MPKTALRAKPASDAGHTWAQDLLHGKADRIVDDALRRGLDGCLADSSPSELAALGDAARYTRRNEVARRVLLAERHRFPGSSTAMEAALFLGRLAAAEQNDGQAVSWFNTYLAEAPGAAHASEALGRKMAIVRRSGAAASARALAEEYLGKYPDGTYSSAARAILKSP